MERKNGITFGQALVLILIAGGIFILGSIFLDSYREEHAKQEISAALNSPEVMNAKLNVIEDETRQLCMAKGYSAKRCDELLNNPLPQELSRTAAAKSASAKPSAWPSAKGRKLSAPDANGCIKELAEETGLHC